MTQPAIERVRWTVGDLELLPDNGNRYEIVDGELFMTRAPRWSHQKVSVGYRHTLNSSAYFVTLHGKQRPLLFKQRPLLSKVAQLFSNCGLD